MCNGTGVIVSIAQHNGCVCIGLRWQTSVSLSKRLVASAPDINGDDTNEYLRIKAGDID